MGAAITTRGEHKTYFRCDRRIEVARPAAEHERQRVRGAEVFAEQPWTGVRLHVLLEQVQLVSDPLPDTALHQVAVGT